MATKNNKTKSNPVTPVVPETTGTAAAPATDGEMEDVVVIECPNCNVEIEDVGELEIDDNVACEGCGHVFVVMSVEPLELEETDDDENEDIEDVDEDDLEDEDDEDLEDDDDEENDDDDEDDDED